MQHKTLDRLTLQNLINAYCFETGHGDIIAVEQQDDIQKQASQNKPLLVLMLLPSNTVMVVPVDRVSQLGQHRLAGTPLILNKHTIRLNIRHATGRPFAKQPMDKILCYEPSVFDY